MKKFIISTLLFGLQSFGVQAQFNPCNHSNNFCQPLKGEQLERYQATIFKDEAGPREHLYVNGVDDSEEFWFEERSLITRQLNQVHKLQLENIPKYQDHHLLDQLKKARTSIFLVCGAAPGITVVGAVTGTIAGVFSSDSVREYVDIVGDGVSSGALTCYSELRTYKLMHKEAKVRGLVDSSEEELSLAEIEFGDLDYGQKVNQDSRSTELNEVSSGSSSRRRQSVQSR